eukprot:scaffold612_cov343-Prasinococcus_capsulatus_cf.AAC.4
MSAPTLSKHKTPWMVGESASVAIGIMAGCKVLMSLTVPTTIPCSICAVLQTTPSSLPNSLFFTARITTGMRPFKGSTKLTTTLDIATFIDMYKFAVVPKSVADTETQSISHGLPAGEPLESVSG